MDWPEEAVPALGRPGPAGVAGSSMSSRFCSSKTPSDVAAAVFDRMLDGIAVLDQADRVVYANPSAAAIFGGPPPARFLEVLRRTLEGTWVEVEVPELRFAEVSVVPIAWK